VRRLPGLDREAFVLGMAWPRPRRLVVASVLYGPQVRTRVAVIDPVSGERVSMRGVRGAPIATVPLPDGIAVLLAEPDVIGHARVAIARADGEWRVLDVPEIQAGSRWPPPDGTEEQAGILREPGLAIGDGAAYVVDSVDRRVARIDLGTGAGRVHDLAIVARAGKMADRHYRSAIWLGDGRLAVWGGRDLPDGRIRQDGVTLVDTRKWTERVVARRGSAVALGDGRFAVWGLPGGGLAIHDREGRLIRRSLEGVDLIEVTVGAGRIYAGDFDDAGNLRRTYVLSADGRALGTALRRPPTVIGPSP
jgi:hypothetical protein